MNELLEELNQIEKQVEQLAKRKEVLAAQLKVQEEAAKRYDEILGELGFKSPRDFIAALMAHYGIRSISLADKAAAKTATGRKPRTKITHELIAGVKAALETKTTKTQIGEDFGISYMTIKKIAAGDYDNK